MGKIKDILKNHYYSVAIFLFLMLYNFIVTDQFNHMTVHKIAHTFHLVDYSFGFCSRFLPGTIYNLLFDRTDIEAVSVYSIVLFTVFMFLTALLLEKLLKTANAESRGTLILILIFFLTGPSTFSVYAHMYGSMDNYWLYISIVFILLLSNKRLYPFIVPLSAILVIVHYASAAAFVPFFLLLMLYKITTIQEKKEKNLLTSVLVISAILSVCLTFYFPMYEKDNLVYSLDEFVSVLDSRGATDFPLYFATSLYEYDEYGLFNSEYFSSIESPLHYAFAFLLYRVKVNFAIMPIEEGLTPLLLISPVVAVIFTYFINKIKNSSDNKLKSFSFFCICSMFFVTIILCLFLSTDIVRFIGHAFTLLFTSFLFVIYTEKEEFTKHIKLFSSKFPKIIIVIYCIFYAVMVTHPV